MRVLMQRVSSAGVTIQGRRVAEIERGLLVFVCVEQGDTPNEIAPAIDKILSLRVFPGPEPNGRPFDRSVVEVDGACLVVSQFTLAASVRKGRRPSFDRSAPPDQARKLYDEFIAKLQARHPKLGTGEFGANMQVSLVNDGPVTLNFVVRAGQVQGAS